MASLVTLRNNCLRALATTVAALALFACQGDELPTEPSASPPEVQPEIAQSGQGGDPRFYFLPPITPEPVDTHTFDPAVSPVVEICALSGGVCENTIATFTMTSGAGSETIRLEEDDEHYIVNWHTDRFDLDPSVHYRIRVSVDDQLMGLADVDVVETGRGKRGVDESEYVPLVLGQSLPIKMRIQMRRLRGDPEASAGPAIPRKDFSPRMGDYSTGHPDFPEQIASFNTLGLSLRINTTIKEANEILDALEGRIVGGLPGVAGEAPGIVLLRIPTVSHEEMEREVDRLNNSIPAVLVAVQDLSARLNRTSSPNPDEDWTWQLVPDGGNWGLELLRVPQLWNWTSGIQRLLDLQKTRKAAKTAIIDRGFVLTHPDLQSNIEGNLQSGAENTNRFHGTHVAGIAGAAFNNNVGVDGVNPFAQLILRTMGTVAELNSWLEIYLTYVNLVEQKPGALSHNMSFGFGWSTISPRKIAKARQHGRLFSHYQSNLANKSTVEGLPVLVVSAGNDFGRVAAKFNSPMANAALEQGQDNIVVVEAVENAPGEKGGARRARLSNVGGHVSAPGVNVVSACDPSIPLNFKQLFTCLGEYGSASGTSQAAPHVAGLVSFLYTLEPDLARPTLTSNPFLDLFNRRDVAVSVAGATSDRIDAFAAALAVDAQLGQTEVLQLLLDVDDGTLDGNLRINHDSSRNISNKNDGDGSGDGEIDMSDFRRYRDWMLTAVFSDDPDLQLDGKPDHPKKDVNKDGEFGDENLYPRGDFNGDGRLDPGLRNPVSHPRLPDEPLTDIEVLLESGLFDDRHYSADAARSLLKSGDIHIVAATCLSQSGVATMESKVTVVGSDTPADDPQFRRFHDADTVEHIYTVSVDEYNLQVEALDAEDNVVDQESFTVEVQLGEDIVWEPECASTNQPPSVTITAPSDGSIFAEGVAVTFEGSAEDPEDGQLTGSSLVWTSDLDGEIGTGESFTRSDLSAGTHTITLTATDSEGIAETSSVEITGGDVIQITDDPAGQLQPAISGDHIVWRDDRTGDINIFLHDLSTEMDTQITDDPASQTQPTISGDHIVWVDSRDGLELFLYDRATGTETQISEGLVNTFSLSVFPDISGDHIVWKDERTGNNDIFMYDLSTGTETQITDDPNSQSHPDVSGDRIVWADNRTGNSDIFMYDLSTGTQTQITDDPNGQSKPSISGDRIVWHDNRTGDINIFLHDLSTGTETQITDDPASQTDPVISGDRIVWQRGPNITLFDLSTSIETQITNDRESQFPPDFSGDRIVWQDSRTGNNDIFLFEIP